MNVGVAGGVSGAAVGATATGLGAAFLIGAAIFLEAAFFLGAAFLAFFGAFFRGAAIRLMPDLREEAFLRTGFLAIFLRGLTAFFFARFFAKLPPPFIPKSEAGRVATGGPVGL